MTIKRITSTHIESNRVILRPRITYTVSGSDITGSMPLVKNPSDSIKVLDPIQTSANSSAGSGNVPAFGIGSSIRSFYGGISVFMQDGIDATSLIKSLLGENTVPGSTPNPGAVVSQPLPSKNTREFNISIENVPGIQFYPESSNLQKTGSLPTIVNSFIENEIGSNRNLEFGFTNYNCIGFVSGANESLKSALMYKDPSTNSQNFASFAVSFFVKPPKVTSSEFRPATIFHIDNLITVSMVSGSTQDRFGNTNTFKIVSQLSSSNENKVDSFIYEKDSLHSNNTAYSDFEREIIFSPKNEIKKDNWYHVAVCVSKDPRSSNKRQDLYIDGSLITGSIVTSISETVFNKNSKNSSNKQNSEIIIGNKISKNTDYSQFFIEKYEDFEKYSATPGASEPASNRSNPPTAMFESPFFGEVHEIVFATSQLEDFPIVDLLNSREKTLNPELINSNLNIDFYLPVLFGTVKNQKLRSWLKSTQQVGALLNKRSPYIAFLAPHENTIISNDLRFPEVNITSFLSAYTFEKNSAVSRFYPRCVGMESIDDVVNDPRYTELPGNPNAHEVSTELSTFFTRNNLIRSCDNSAFVHDFDSYEKIIDDIGGSDLEKSERKYYLSSSMGTKDISHVSMKNYISSTSGITGTRNSFINTIAESISENYMDNLSTINEPYFDKNIFSDHSSYRWTPKLFAETLYNSSNLVSIINIPQIFYSNKIHPGTFEMIEHDLSGSQGMLTYNIKDNGLGALYRDDSAASDPRNKCGIILYDMGLAILTHPSLCMLGKNNYTIKFRGEKDLNVLNVNAHIGKYEFNESINPNYNLIGKAGSNSNNEEIVMITGIEYLDEDLNVVMRSNLSKPVSKREFDEILFRSRIDF